MERMQTTAPDPKEAYGNRKVPLGFVPAASVIYEADAFAVGAEKYGPYSWREKPVAAMTYAHAALRHIYAWIDGEDIDPESGKPHLGHAKACMGILADAIETGNLIDNRPVAGEAGRMLRNRETNPTPAPIMTATECITGFRGVVLDKAIQEGLARERDKKQAASVRWGEQAGLKVETEVDRLRARAAAYQNFDGEPHDVLDGVCLRCGHPTDRKCRCTGG